MTGEALRLAKEIHEYLINKASLAFCRGDYDEEKRVREEAFKAARVVEILAEAGR